MSRPIDVVRAMKAGFGDFRSSQHYEGTFTTDVLRAIQPGSIFADCGVCHGYYTALALRAGASIVWAFEPDDAHIPALKHEFAAHPRIHLVPKAVSDTTGTVELFKVRNGGGRGISATRKIALKQRRPSVKAKKVVLDCVCLDDALPNGAHVIKIDAEGSELAILRGAQKILAAHDTKLFVQFHDGNEKDVEELRELVYGVGYAFFDLVGERIEPKAPLTVSCEISKP